MMKTTSFILAVAFLAATAVVHAADNDDFHGESPQNLRKCVDWCGGDPKEKRYNFPCVEGYVAARVAWLLFSV